MTRLTRSLVLAPLLAFVMHGAPAQAQLARTFISATGSDGNPCSRVQPCRTLQGAHDKTNAGGEINMLDPAGYGIVTITKAISIVNDGVGSAGVLVGASQTGITIAALNTDAINLRGLIIEGSGAGAVGIQFNSGKSLTIENSVIRNMQSNGIVVATSSGNANRIAISNTVISDNGNIGIWLRVLGSSSSLQAVLDRVELYNNGGNALIADGSLATGTAGIVATVSDSVAVNNGNVGFFALTTIGQAPVALMVTRSVTANNNFGVIAQGPTATARVGRSAITGNATGWGIFDSGLLRSYGDNYVDGNGAGEGAMTTIPPK
ncbi:MAG: hypothetical protein QOI12_1067 [Alphaproteobacteria bacterium]|jgi:hypothetical protein|nr:hypothetical protein [Alphaproteobacteria bacterium]